MLPRNGDTRDNDKRLAPNPHQVPQVRSNDDPEPILAQAKYPDEPRKVLFSENKQRDCPGVSNHISFPYSVGFFEDDLRDEVRVLNDGVYTTSTGDANNVHIIDPSFYGNLYATTNPALHSTENLLDQNPDLSGRCNNVTVSKSACLCFEFVSLVFLLFYLLF